MDSLGLPQDSYSDFYCDYDSYYQITTIPGTTTATTTPATTTRAFWRETGHGWSPKDP